MNIIGDLEKKTRFAPRSENTSDFEKQETSKIHIKRKFDYSLPEFMGCGIVFDIYRNRK